MYTVPSSEKPVGCPGLSHETTTGVSLRYSSDVPSHPILQWGVDRVEDPRDRTLKPSDTVHLRDLREIEEEHIVVLQLRFDKPPESPSQVSGPVDGFRTRECDSREVTDSGVKK